MVLYIVRIPTGLNRQHVRHKQNVLHLCHFIADVVALYAGYFDVCHVAGFRLHVFLHVVQRCPISRNRKNIANLQRVITTVGKGSAGGIPGCRSVGVNLINAIEHVIGKIFRLLSENFFNIAVQSGIRNFALFRPDIQITHRCRLFRSVYFKPCILVQQLHLIHLTGFQFRCHSCTVDCICHRTIGFCNIDELDCLSIDFARTDDIE